MLTITRNHKLSRTTRRWPLQLLFLMVVLLVLVSELHAAGKNFYDILGIRKDASESDIKKAYKKLAVKMHPDKNKGDPDAETRFMEIANAYEVLSDPKKRQIYDQYGEEGLKSGAAGGGSGFHNPTDIFSQFFGNAFTFGGNPFNSEGSVEEDLRGPDLAIPLDVTLEDLYNGQVLEFHRQRTAHKEGAKPRKCECRNKRVTMTIQMGGVVKQVADNNCEECRDRFEVISKSTSLLVDIEKGMSDGTQIKFYGEADAGKDKTAGDLIFVIRTKPHKLFRRHGNDLIMKHSISLKEALIGFSLQIKHLDGREIVIRPPSNVIMRPGSTLEVEGEGMPIQNSPSQKGKLLVELDVVFPDKLTPQQQQSLSQIL